MKKIYNPGENIVLQQLEGFVDAYSSLYAPLRDGRTSVVLKNHRSGDKVRLIVGGGSGHEPLFPGLVGYGLADAAVCGNVFAAPNPQLIYDTVMDLPGSAGVLFVYGNYAGDNLNFDVAEEMLEDAGVACAHVRVWDDCASAPRDGIQDRRGIAGDVFVIKIAGAACDAGLPMEEVLRITEKARDRTASIGLATSPGSIPGLDRPTFELGETEIEYGMGLHGEPGIERTVMQSADALTERLYRELKAEVRPLPGERFSVLVNGLGSTTLLELNIVYRKFAQLARGDGLTIHDGCIDRICTCQEMGGFSVSLLRLDDELLKYYDAPCYSPYYAKEDRR